MTSPGTLLRQERERQQRTIVALASETRIPSRYLEAMEQGDYSALPGDFFYRTWTKQYATALGLDSPELWEAIRRAAPPVDTDVLAALSANYQPLRPSRRTRPLGAGLAFIAVVGATFAGGAIYGLLRP